MTEALNIEDVTEGALVDLFTSFLKGFKDPAGNPKYRMLISSLPAQNKTSIDVDLLDLSSYSDSGSDLAALVLRNPRKTIRAFSRAASEIVAIYDPVYQARHKSSIQVRLKGLFDFSSIASVGERIVEQLISLRGIVTKTSQKVPRLVVGAYRCKNGHYSYIHAYPPEHVIGKPLTCEEEGCTDKSFTLEQEKSEFVAWQVARLQENPEDLSAGELPEGYDLDLIEDLVDRVRPGDRVIVNCIVVRQEIRPPTGGVHRFHYRLLAKYLDLVGKRPEDVEITKEEEEDIRSIAKSPGARERLVQSVAPSIMGHEIHKEAILLSVVGSSSKKTKDGRTIRGDIHLLLAGDPSTGKSELLKYVHDNVAPRSVWATGKRTTSAGLGAAVVPEKDKTWSLEAGAAVWADLGVLMLDELDKMSPDHRDALHDIMEQQQTSVNAAGIHATLMTRCAVIASMNPVNGRWDSYKNLMENISLPPSLVSRFDLIFIVLDEADPAVDDKLVDHLGSLYEIEGSKFPLAPIQQDLMKKYVAFAKKINPQLTRESMSKIKEYYLSMRTQASASPDMIPVTPRWLHATIRVTFAEARLLLHERTTENDALRAIQIMKRMIETVATDPSTKQVDTGILYGKPLTETRLVDSSLALFKELEGYGANKVEVEDAVFWAEFVKRGLGGEETARKIWKTMYRAGQIYEKSPHFFRRI